MIERFRVVIPNVLYRGSAPSPNDIKWLKDKLGVKKIVSLDKQSGERVNRVCKLLGIQHIKMYIQDDRKTLLNFLTQDLKKLFLEGGPTFCHCFAGHDRTGLAMALVQCKFLGVKPEKAIQEAKSLGGFGIDFPPSLAKLYEKIIRSCKPIKDNNSADIVSNERTYIGDNRDSFLDEAHQGSFAPYLDPTRMFPYDAVYNEINDQSPTRENYNQETSSMVNEDQAIPNVGVYNNDGGGINGQGPCINSGGFIYD